MCKSNRFLLTMLHCMGCFVSDKRSWEAGCASCVEQGGGGSGSVCEPCCGCSVAY